MYKILFGKALGDVCGDGKSLLVIICLSSTCETCQYDRTPIIRINWNGEPSGYADNPDNWIFFLTVGYIGSLKFGCYY